MKRFGTSVLSLSLLSSVLCAQRDLRAGFGAESLVVDLVSAQGGHQGLVYLNGEIFVPFQVNPAVGGQHFVAVFDDSGSGVAVRSWFQPGLAQASEWGFRDGATDGEHLFFGFDFGIQIFDVNGVNLTGIGIPNIQTANGPAFILGGLISGNVLAPDQAGTIRALAYDRNGNGGDGSFWTGNFTSSMFEINLAGDILQTFANAGEKSFSFGLDPVSDGTRMWIDSGPDLNTIVEYDLTTGTLTGNYMETGHVGSGQPGGLDVVPGTLGRGPNASGWDILHLGSGQPSEFQFRRLHLDVAGQGVPPSPVTRLGTLEPDLLVSIDDEDIFPRSDRGRIGYSCDSFELDLFFDIARNPGDGLGSGGLNGTPAVIFANIGPDAAIGVEVISNLLGIRELAHLQPGLTMPGAQSPVRSRGIVLSNDPMLPSTSEWRIALTPGQPFQGVGDCVRFQGVWIDAGVNFLPIALTNQIRTCRSADPAIFPGCGQSSTYAEFSGQNTFNADESSGYFSLTNESSDPGLSIVAATWSINPGDPNNSPRTQALFENRFRWDTDNPNMVDLFEGGNSLFMGCTGTYRNGSEVSSGLIFAGTESQNGSPCDDDPLVLQGWIGSDDGPSIFGSADGDFLTIGFTFDPDTFMNGVVFEFDVDTDGGVGVNGNSMAGIIVTVEFKNGMVRSGEVMADVNNPGRAFVAL